MSRCRCEQLAAKARLTAQAEEWAVLRPSGATSSGTVPAVEAFLEQGLMRLARRNEEHYNENAPLGEAITDAVAMADILEGWPSGLTRLAEVVEKKELSGERW